MAPGPGRGDETRDRRPNPSRAMEGQAVPTLTGLAGPGDGETHGRPQGKSAVNQAGNGWEAEEQC